MKFIAKSVTRVALAGAFGLGAAGVASAQDMPEPGLNQPEPGEIQQPEQPEPGLQQNELGQKDELKKDEKLGEKSEAKKDEFGQKYEARKGQTAQAGWQNEDKTAATERMNKLRQVQGEIVAIKDVEVRGTDVKTKVALLKTKKGDKRLIIDLGPSKNFEGQNLTKGTQLAVQGPVVRLQDRQLLLARKAKLGDKVIEIDRADQLREGQKAGVPQG